MMIINMKNRQQRKNSLYPFAYIFCLAAIMIAPWVLFLGYTLPAREIAAHWRLTWIGFDILLTLMFAVTAVAAVIGHRWLISLAPATAALLLCDAWFDILTAHKSSDFHMAVATALIGEIPLAIICIIATVIAHREFFEP